MPWIPISDLAVLSTSLLRLGKLFFNGVTNNNFEKVFNVFSPLVVVNCENVTDNGRAFLLENSATIQVKKKEKKERKIVYFLNDSKSK